MLECKISLTKTNLFWEITHLSLEPQLSWRESLFLQEVTLKTLNMVTSFIGSQRFTRETLLLLITNVDTTDNLALALVPTLPASIQSKMGLVLFKLWISNLKYVTSILYSLLLEY